MMFMSFSMCFGIKREQFFTNRFFKLINRLNFLFGKSLNYRFDYCFIISSFIPVKVYGHMVFARKL